MQIAHPTIWKFIKVLKKDAVVQQVRIAHFNAGQQPEGQRRVYQDLNNRLKTLVNDYGCRDILDYLRNPI